LLHDESLNICRISPDGRFVLLQALGERNFMASSRLRVYDLQAREVRTLPSHGDAVYSVAWHPSGRYIVTGGGGADGVIRVGPVSGEEPHLLVGHIGAASVLVSPDGKWIASGGSDGTFRLWPWPEGRPVHTLPHDQFVAKIRSLTNYRVVPDDASVTGYRLGVGTFPGWEELPTW
jgi:WD40 repeat protein